MQKLSKVFSKCRLLLYLWIRKCLLSVDSESFFFKELFRFVLSAHTLSKSKPNSLLPSAVN